LDLEGRARQLYTTGVPKKQIIEELSNLSGSVEKANAILNEIINTENISDEFIQKISCFKTSGLTADQTGLGCRGEGDFFIHRKLAELFNNQNSIIDARDQDDAGVVQVGKDYIIVSVDGMHSRLSHFPFIAGFHVARAAIRDTLVMGCEPKALFSDIHLANDGDVAKIFDYSAGIAVVSELSEIPLISGSTLRIGGDLVLGDRLTGCVGCVGYGEQLTPRRNVTVGDVLVMTEGAGGGTIATTALYNGFSGIVTETLNLKNIFLGLKLLRSPLLKKVHAITDITNGGLRGDAFEIAKSANVQITINEREFRNLINPEVLRMLTKLGIDPLGVSIDSLLLILPKNDADEVLRFINDNGLKASIVGHVEAAKSMDAIEQHGDVLYGVKLIKPSKASTAHGPIKPRSEDAYTDLDEQIIKLEPKYREEPYTPIKKVVNVQPKDLEKIKTAISEAVEISKEKKEQLKNWITSRG